MYQFCFVFELSDIAVIGVRKNYTSCPEAKAIIVGKSPLL